MPWRAEFTLCQTHHAALPTDLLLLGTATEHEAALSPRSRSPRQLPGCASRSRCPRSARAVRTAVRAHRGASDSENPTVKVAGSGCTGGITKHGDTGGQVGQQLSATGTTRCSARASSHTGLTADQAPLHVWGIQGRYAELGAAAQTPTDLPGHAQDGLEGQRRMKPMETPQGHRQEVPGRLRSGRQQAQAAPAGVRAPGRDPAPRPRCLPAAACSQTFAAELWGPPGRR